MTIKTFPTGPAQANSYLLYDENQDEAVMIDPGDDASALMQHVKKSGKTLIAILLTHGHFDHIGAVAEIVEVTGAKVYIGTQDASMLENASQNLSASFSKIVIAKSADVLINEGDTLHLAGLTIQVLHTPGHTQGSMCFIVDGQLFSGDTLFCNGVGRTDLPGGDLTQLGASLKRLQKLDRTLVVHAGHGKSTILGHEVAGL